MNCCARDQICLLIDSISSPLAEIPTTNFSPPLRISRILILIRFHFCCAWKWKLCNERCGFIEIFSSSLMNLIFLASIQCGEKYFNVSLLWRLEKSLNAFLATNGHRDETSGCCFSAYDPEIIADDLIARYASLRQKAAKCLSWKLFNDIFHLFRFRHGTRRASSVQNAAWHSTWKHTRASTKVRTVKRKSTEIFFFFFRVHGAKKCHSP